MMTPEQKIKLEIIRLHGGDSETTLNEDNIDDAFNGFVEGDISGDFQDAIEEFRQCGEVTGIETSDWSRHYECKSVAAPMGDGSWVGWTYWYGGGKHGEPEAMEWMSDAYEVEMTEEMRPVRVFVRK